MANNSAGENGGKGANGEQNVSFRWSHERVEDLEDAIFEAKSQGVFEKNASRSTVLRSITADFIDEYLEREEGNQKMMNAMAD